ncbi:immunity repressor [Gordonia phage Tarzan]|uniref:Immunity repressor n=1 Tax=Gordonia phage Tarzan TaxID=3038367 RepID=A0AAF0GGX7_9CAUD|nr:immunity repressor [Gordonia phage Tarzan]WGH20067.1 immunity repressor [Gordonia phage Tarzan]
MTRATETGGWRPSDSLANRVRLIRAEMGLTMKQAAERVGTDVITERGWQSIEEGRSPRQLDVKVKRIALALGVDRDWLMWGGPLGNDGGTGGDGNGPAPIPTGPGDESPLTGSNRRPLAYKVASLAAVA